MTPAQTDVDTYAHKQNIEHYKSNNSNKGLKMFMISTCSIPAWTDVEDRDCHPTISVPISVIKCNNSWEVKLIVRGKKAVPDSQNSLFSVLKSVFSLWRISFTVFVCSYFAFSSSYSTRIEEDIEEALCKSLIWKGHGYFSLSILVGRLFNNE